MGSIAAHVAAIKKGIAAGDGAAVAQHARAIQDLSKIIPSIFPKGSGPEMGKTRAKPEIWQNWAQFVQSSEVLGKEAGALALAAKSGNKRTMNLQFARFGKLGCGGCHTKFRGPKLK